VHQGRASQVLPADDRQDGDPPLGAALNFKADDPVDAALQGAFLAAISFKFEHQLSSKPKPRP
jgi:hypothetical protein